MFVNDNNDIQSQTEITYGESTYYKKATELDVHKLQRRSRVKWQRTVEFNSELKLYKHATEQSEKLSDLKELQSMQFHKITTLDSIKR